MVGLDEQSAPKQLINEVPSHVVLVNNKVGTSQNLSYVNFLVNRANSQGARAASANVNTKQIIL